MAEPVKKKRGRKPKPKPENEVPKVKKKRGRKPKPKTEPEVPKVKKKRGRKKKCDIDALNKITGYSNIGESIDMVDNKINFSECDNNLDENLPSQKISFGNLSIIVQIILLLSFLLLVAYEFSTSYLSIFISIIFIIYFDIMVSRQKKDTISSKISDFGNK